MSTLSLQPIVDVSVMVTGTATTRRTFDQGLIIGTSSVVPHSERIRQYTSIDDMLTDGFTDESPEYLAANLYFAQDTPATYVWIGRQDLTAIATVDIDSGGTGYAVGDTLVVTQSGASSSILRVAAVTAGVVTSVTITDGGTGYSAATGLPTTTSGSGTSCTIDILTIGETAVTAVTACRQAGNEWYPCVVCGATKSDHEAIAAYVEAATPSTTYMYTTQDTDVLNSSVATDIFSVLKGLDYDRSWGLYSGQSVYAAAGAMGVAMGLNTGLADSAYTLKFKSITGISVDSLTQTQVTAATSKKGNTYCNYGTDYDMISEGYMASGVFFDQQINRDMLANNIQRNVMDLLYGQVKVAQTDSGITLIVNEITSACKEAVTIGYIAPGTWTGATVLNLKKGDSLTSGYLVQAEKIADQSTANRNARKAPNIYACVKEAGAVHSVTIGVYVNV
jgi:Protein of unknown function (DUF3383)